MSVTDRPGPQPSPRTAGAARPTAVGRPSTVGRDGTARRGPGGARVRAGGRSWARRPGPRPGAPWHQGALARVRDPFLENPVRLVPVGFLLAILIGTALLSLPVSRTDPGGGALLPALFTSVSAVCVTGLATVDTATFWTPFGQGVVLALVQVGGFGIMTLSTLLALLVRKRLGLWTQLVAASETQALNLGDVRRVLVRVAQIMLGVELVVAVVLTLRFWIAYDHGPGRAAWHGVFHAVSAFNNAGFAVYGDNLVGFVADPWIIIPICAAVVLGGLGFPVVIELLRGPKMDKAWAVHTRLTVYGSLGLFVLGFVVLGAFEWNRPETLGGLGPGGRLLGALGLTVFPRTAGFNSIDYGAAAPETLVVTNVLMFIGGGSAGTAGGIKVTTFLVLAFAIWNEVRGHDQVTVGPRSISSSVQRQALSVALLGMASVTLGTILLLVLTDHGLEQVAFEAVSAFATVGLSTGITGHLPAAAQAVLMALMFIGRVGVTTVAVAIALKTRPRRYRLPEERPIIG
ncbi:TrkH family potassium uptake protein [Citricoccus sp. SGAir0253]|uniref:TrkH family potassium uptake protein n=1 Tax=Citricoccus sp. SGAir0253 TaxID=2567881 RepID=UPI0010CD4D38|nr:potassium transporter TrkG [Citricoccus sp. SGAir0253]QCU77270.1 TrkH family potassium uptake protein [Citricoccus sp. SGAir0253]